MNDMILAGIVVVGTLLAAGGGAWIARVFSSKKDAPKDAPKA